MKEDNCVYLRFKTTDTITHGRRSFRTLLSVDASRELDKSIEEFLLQLGPYLMEAPSSSILEWLVRRFSLLGDFYFILDHDFLYLSSLDHFELLDSILV